MKTALRLALLFVFAFVLAFSQLSPARANDETPPTDAAADTFVLARVVDVLGSASSSPSYMTVFNNVLFYAAESGLGRELWFYNSTLPIGPANPGVIDICPGGGSSNPQFLEVYDGALYFSADGCDSLGIELWKFTGAPPQLVADIASGPASSNPSFLTVMGDKLYFGPYYEYGLGMELWVYDSALPITPSNPVLIDLCSGPASSSPTEMALYNNALYISMNGCDGAGQELWKYTEVGGAQPVVDINPGSAHSFPDGLAVYNGSLYFSAIGDDAGFELWMYDDVDGVQLAADVNPGSGSSVPVPKAAYNGALYFSADGGDNAGQELWKYDPVNGADRVADIKAGFTSSSPSDFAVYNGVLYFGADNGDGAGRELWRYDNTATARYRPAKLFDGWVLESSENSNVGGPLSNVEPGLNLGDDSTNRQYRSILSFNTSNLPDNAVIVSATLKIRQLGLVGTNPFTTLGNILIDITKGAFSGSNALQASDFQVAPSKAGAGVIKNQPDPNNWFTGKLAKTAFPFINKAGVTQLRLRFAKDDNNNNDFDMLVFYSANWVHYSDYPLLEVKYYIP